MTPTRRPARGSCLPIILLAFAVIGLLILIASLALMFTANAGDNLAKFEKELQVLQADATAFEAPGTLELALEPGGALVLISPDGSVGDKRIGRPPANVSYTLTVTSSAGAPVPIESSNMPRNPSAAFELLGWFSVGRADTYTIEVRTTDGSPTPAAIMVCAGDQTQIDTVVAGLGAIGKVAGGICGAICGLVVLLGFGIPALVLRLRRRKPDALEQI